MPLKKYKRGAIWHLKGTVAGELIRESTGVGDAKRAEAIRQRREHEILERHAHGYAATLTFAEAVIGYIDAGGTARFLDRLLEHAGPDLLLRDVGNRWISETAAALYPTAAPATINRQVIAPVSAVYNMAAREGLVPLRRFTRRKEPRGRVRWLTPEEAERLIEAAAALTLPRHATPEPYTLQKVAFLLSSGCRASECFAARAEDWNAATWQWWIRGEEIGAGKTEGAARYVRLTPRAIGLIGALPEEGRAFRTPYGKEIALSRNSGGQMETAFKRAREAAGLGPDVTPHVLRHTWATWYYAATRDFGGLMDLGGWRVAETANRYRKLAPDDLPERLLSYGWDFLARPLPAEGAGRTAAIRRIR